jgi:hypothetical protein
MIAGAAIRFRADSAVACFRWVFPANLNARMRFQYGIVGGRFHLATN